MIVWTVILDAFRGYISAGLFVDPAVLNGSHVGQGNVVRTATFVLLMSFDLLLTAVLP